MLLLQVVHCPQILITSFIKPSIMKNFILLFVIFFTTQIFAQTQTRDIVYLKNGSIIKGQIIEMKPAESLKIETADGSLFVYKMSEILKMEKEIMSTTVNIQNTTNRVEELSERRAKEVVETIFSNVILSESVKIVGIVEWNSELRKDNDIKRYIIGKVRLEVFNYGKWIIQYPSTTFWFTRIDNEWYLDGVGTNFDGYAYVSYGRWVRAIYEKVSEVKTKSQIQEKTNQLLKAGDWKQTDISELTLNPIYLKSANVPLFENSSNKFTVKKLPKRCNDCRNDNIMSIENSLRNAISGTNRYSSINETDFTNSSNKSKVTFYVSQISFKHKGVNDKGNDKGFSCSITYAVSTRATFTSPQEFTFKDTKSNIATSSVWKIYSNKRSAFSGALLEFENQIKKTIIKNFPLSLSVKSIELDKKGNAEYIILENSNNFFDTKEVDFYIIEKSSLSVINEGFKISVVLGIAAYKKADFPNEIKMKISESKMKKALKKYIGKETELIGISK
jgi:hypothetical protein